MIFRIFLRYYRLRIARHFRKNRAAKTITAVLFLAVVAAVAIGLFFGLRQGFVFTLHDRYLARAFPLYVNELFLLITGFLVFASAAITSLFGLFRNDIDRWIMASPSFGAITQYVSWRVFATSLWPFFIVSLPALLALHSVFRFGAVGLILASCAVFLFVALAVSLGILAVVLLARMFMNRKKPFLKTVAGVAALFAILVGIMGWAIGQRDLVDVFGATNLKSQSADPALIMEQFGFLPSHLPALIIFDLQNGDNKTALTFLVILIFGTAATTGAVKLSFRSYLPLWQRMQEGSFEARPLATKTSAGGGRVSKSYSFHGPFGAIFKKERLTMLRDGRNALWLWFLIILIGVQTVLNFMVSRNIASSHGGGGATTPQIIGGLQFITSVFFISTFVLRFAFPAFSAERKTAWIIASAPIDFAKLFWAKWGFYTTAFLIIGLGSALLNFFILNFAFAATNFALLAVAIVFVTSLGLSFGALFPNFETDDPQALSTSLAGLGFTFLSLLYTGCSYLFLFAKIATPMTRVGFLIASIVLVIALLLAAAKKIRSVEFVRVVD